MNDKLNIPKVIKVGFQNRTDTYTGKLAYVVYIDNKGKLRKEASWEGWRDKKIDPIDYPNEPTNGFVLNKDVGGTQRSWSWNARREKVRVYDPRNFEFEISVENLLFILQECSAIKGKGLEGEFVYAWSGPELILLPVCSQEYKSSIDFGNLQENKISAKDIEPGCTYLTKDEQEVMYLGRFDWWEKRRIKEEKKSGYYSYSYKMETKPEKRHIFVYMNKEKRKGRGLYWAVSGFVKLAKRTSETPISQYADEYEKLNKTGYTSKPIKVVFVDGLISDEFIKDYYNRGLVGVYRDGTYFTGNIRERNWYDRDGEKEKWHTLDLRSVVEISDGVITQYYVDDKKGIYKDKISKEDALAIVKKIYIECENGSKYPVESHY